MAPNNQQILTAAPPLQWPAVPDWSSFWWLIEVETCPRRVALRTASYPDLWDRPGYPPKPTVAAILGQIVHTAVGSIATILGSRGVASVRDPHAISILRELGGFSQIISRAVDDVVDRLANNPRLYSPDRLRSEVLRRLPWMREKVQALLSRMVLPTRTQEHSEAPRDSKQALGTGLHFEILLKSSVLQWKGVADLIEISSNKIAIADFKTGEPSRYHTDQIRTYALLWARDLDSNPQGSLATDLVLSYPDGSVTTPAPSKTELLAIESDLQRRTAFAKSAMRAQQPSAHVAPEHCSQCDVRHLCSEYWIPSSRKCLVVENRIDFDDIELLIEERLGQSSWRCKCLVATHVPTDSTIILSLGNDNLTLAPTVNTNSTVRVVGALLSHGEHSPSVASVVGSSELFRVPESP